MENIKINLDNARTEDSEYAYNLRRAYLYQLKSLISSLESGIDNPRVGFFQTIEEMMVILEDLPLYAVSEFDKNNNFLNWRNKSKGGKSR